MKANTGRPPRVATQTPTANPTLFAPHVAPLTPQRIYQVRNLLGYSQAELGAVLGYTANTVGGWERGENMESARFQRQSRTVSLALTELERQFTVFERERRGPLRFNVADPPGTEACVPEPPEGTPEVPPSNLPTETATIRVQPAAPFFTAGHMSL